MKQITLFALLFFSFNCWSQKTIVTFNKSHASATYNGVEIYSDINKLKSSLLAIGGNKLVSHNGNTLIISSSSYGVLSTLVFKSNPLSGIVYYFSRTITKGISYAMTPMETYTFQVEEIISITGFKPYEYNSDPENGGVYSKWLFSNGSLIVKLNNQNNLVVQSERLYDQDIIDFVNSLEVKK